MRFAALAFILISVPAHADDKHPTQLVDVLSAVDRPEGAPFVLAVKLRIDDGWHVYWKNPGETGLATRVEFELPPGFSHGPIRFPGPKRFLGTNGIESYGYESSVVISTLVTPPKTLEKQPTFKVKARWLSCKKTCIPDRAERTLTYPTISSVGHAKELAQHAAALPKPMPANGAIKWAGNTLQVRGVSGPLEYFPSKGEQVHYQGQSAANGGLDVQYKQKAQAAGILKAAGAYYHIEPKE